MDKEKYSHFLKHPLLIILFTCLCLLAIFSLRESTKKASVSKESIQKLEKTVNTLEKEVTKDKQKLEETQNPIAIEKIVRNELLLKKEDEIILQIPESEESSQNSQDQIKQKSGPIEEWRKLLRI